MALFSFIIITLHRCVCIFLQLKGNFNVNGVYKTLHKCTPVFNCPCGYIVVASGEMDVHRA